ncbi:MAG TPA: hypothetical protein VGH54_28245 [Mycobacterium sp.]|uniref:hypothetical protein n=1 Tax=Mycobacterium sp. TaxID=1785 RepID=UPI002F4119A7
MTQLYALARRAGLPPDKAVKAAAVAMAESGGRTWVTSPNPDGGTNVGPWQLDTPGGGGSGYTVAQLQNPYTNAEAMAKASGNGTDWSSWQTAAEGSDQQYIPAALTASTKESGGGGSWIDGVLHSIEAPFKAAGDAAGKAASTGGGLFNMPSQITDFFDTADQFVQAMAWVLNPANWVRLLSGAAGGVLLIAGLVYLAKAA